MKIFSVTVFTIFITTFLSSCYITKKALGSQTIDSVIQKLEPKIGKKVSDLYKKNGVEFPTNELYLLAFKEEKQLDIYIRNREQYIKLLSYPILAASGTIGHKLLEGDRQVPEGIYQIEYLNPNSSFYLSMKINYPNEEDMAMAKADGRNKPGSNIFIHGKNVSIGCLAIGDDSIEELFYIVQKTGHENVKVYISPYDFRKKQQLDKDIPDGWIGERYKILNELLKKFP